MKKKIMFLLVSSWIVANAYSEVNDTIIVVNHPQKVVLEEKKDKVVVRINGRNVEGAEGTEKDTLFSFSYEHGCEQNESFVEQKANDWNFDKILSGTIPVKRDKSKREKTSSSFQLGGIGFGFVGALNAPKNMNVDMAASKEIFFDAISFERQYDYGRHNLSVGLGFHWRNYRMTGDQRFVKKESKVQLEGYPENSTIDFSRIKVFSVTFPFEYELRLHKEFSFAMAAILNVNTHASMKTRYSVDGNKKTDFTEHIHHTPVSIDLRTSLRWRSLGVYFKYAPCKVLNTAYGPDFSGFSAGLMFGF